MRDIAWQALSTEKVLHSLNVDEKIGLNNK